MGQIVSSAAKPKRCNLNKLNQVPTPAAGEYILVSSDNSMNAAGQGNFDCYIVGDGTTAATESELKLINSNELFILSTFYDALQKDSATPDDFTIEGFIYKTNGQVLSHGVYRCTDFIPVIPTATYLMRFSCTSNAACCYYDINKRYTGEYIQAYYETDTEVVIPKNAYYIRMSSNVNIGKLKLKGDNFEDLESHLIGLIPSVPTKVSELQNDLGFLTNNNAATKTAYSTDILSEAEPPSMGVVLNNDGTTTTNASFYVYENVDISSYIGKSLFPYNEIAPNHCFRNIVTFDSSNNVLRVITGTPSIVADGFVFQNGEVRASICFYMENGTASLHYISTQKGSTNKYVLDSVRIPFGYIDNAPIISRTKLFPQTKLPCISFQFDDMYEEGDELVANLFMSHDSVCGFACIGSTANMASDKSEKYLLWNLNGFEILNHSIDWKSITSTYYTYETALTAVMSAKNNLENRGYVINGFVAPSSIVESNFVPIIKLSHAFAFTSSTTSTTSNNRNSDTCDLHRYSMQSNTTAQIKAFIDGCIENDQLITLYGHTQDFGTTYSDAWNLEKVEEILEYVLAKRNAGLLFLGNTTDCVKYYFDL